MTRQNISVLLLNFKVFFTSIVAYLLVAVMTFGSPLGIGNLERKLFLRENRSLQVIQLGFNKTFELRGENSQECTLALNGFPLRQFLVEEFEGLSLNLYVTENLVERLSSAQLFLDSYKVGDDQFENGVWKTGKPWMWPEQLTHDEEKLSWLRWDSGGLHLIKS